MSPPMSPPISGARRLTVAIGLGQTLSWATSFYLPAIVAGAAAASLGASRTEILGGFSWALLVNSVCAPRIGRHIDRAGGRMVLALGSVTLAAGLAVLAAAGNLAAWYAGWTVMGLGMALSLYDAAFATIGRLLGTAATPAITGVTLFAGFASTLGWPAGAVLIGRYGWRATLLCYAALQLAVIFPAMLLAIPRALPAAASRPAPQSGAAGAGRGHAGTLACLSGFFTLRWFLTSGLAVFALPLLRGNGLSAGQAVFAAALIGPGQVLGRLLEWGVGRRFGLLARARVAAAVMPASVLLLLLPGPVAACGFALGYGMSNGILTINRGTLPLALFGPAGYAALLGWLAVPVLLAQAAAPTLLAPLLAVLSGRAVFLLIAAVGSVAALLLLPLRLPLRLPSVGDG